MHSRPKIHDLSSRQQGFFNIWAIALLHFPATPSNRTAMLQFPATPSIMHDIGWCWLLCVAAAYCCLPMDRATKGIHFSFLREKRESHSRIQGVCIIRRSSGGHVVEVGVETVLSWRKVYWSVLAGDLDQVLGLWAGTVQPVGQTRHRRGDRCSGSPVSSPSWTVEWRSGRPRRLRQDMRWRSDCRESELFAIRDMLTLNHQALSQCRCNGWNVRCETTVPHGARRETCACVLRPARCSVFTSPSRARHSQMSVGEVFFRNYECARSVQTRWGLRVTAFTTSPTIVDLATLLVATLATVEDFPSVANSTMSLTMTMTTTPVFHGYASIAGIRLEVENVVANQWVFVVSFLVERCKRSLVLGDPAIVARSFTASLNFSWIDMLSGFCRILPF